LGGTVGVWTQNRFRGVGRES